MRRYKCLNQQVFESKIYQLIPIRDADKYAILEWRNSQINILRQKEILTKEKQERYFKEVVTTLFEEKQPKQLLFSFLADEVLIGYGGLVHINWGSKHAEISFLLSNHVEIADNYQQLFGIFLHLIEQVASNLSFHKIFTFGYATNEERFFPLIKNQFSQEVVLTDHIKIGTQFFDIKIYSKFVDEHYTEKN